MIVSINLVSMKCSSNGSSYSEPERSNKKMRSNMNSKVDDGDLFPTEIKLRRLVNPVRAGHAKPMINHPSRYYNSVNILTERNRWDCIGNGQPRKTSI